MMYINEESWEVVVDFEEIEYIEEDIVEYMEELVENMEINSYEDHKYWISCRNMYHAREIYDLVEDKIERLS